MADLAPTIQSTARDPQSVRTTQVDGNGTTLSPNSFLGLLTSALSGAVDQSPQGPANSQSAAIASTNTATSASPKPDAAPLQIAGLASTASASPVVPIAAPTSAVPNALPNQPMNSRASGIAATANPARALATTPTPAPQPEIPNLDAAAPAGQPATAESAATLAAGTSTVVPASVLPTAATPTAPDDDTATVLGQNNPSRSSPSGATASQAKTAAKSGSGVSTRSTRDTADSEDPAQPIQVAATPIPAALPVATLPIQQPLPKPSATAQEPVATATASVSQAPASSPLEAKAESRPGAAAASTQTDSNAQTATKLSAPTTAPEPAQTITDTLSASATTTPTSHAAAQPLAAPASVRDSAETPAPAPTPAVQVAQAIAEPVKVSLANSPQQQAGAAHVMTIHLAPSDLGRVDIRIERPTDGPAKIELRVERPETLQRLVHDQPQLQQALDQAGIPQTGRTIQFSLSADTGSSSSNPGSNLAGDGNSNGSGQRSQQGYPGSQSRSTEQIDAPATYASWARSGLDITA